jgi:hypothetical protein
MIKMNNAMQLGSNTSLFNYDSSSQQVEELIQEVIAKRQSLALKVKPVQQHLIGLQQEVLDLNDHCQTLKGKIADVDARQSLEKLNLAQLESSIAIELTRLQDLINRFSRRTLNIGVVGKMRQGKSTFLQRLSGLPDVILPARPGKACTAVRSKIYHHDDVTRALITLHSESTFLYEVIAPYYERLNLGTPPQTIDEFANSDFPDMASNESVSKAMYDHLYNDYFLGLTHYRGSLGDQTQQLDITNESEIALYVAQTRGDDGRLASFNHLAVKDVEISCRFPESRVEKLGLIDVPGLGDLRLGDEELILKTLGQEVDIVLFFRKPFPGSDQWQQPDTNLYDLAAKALPDVANRSFMVLNRQQTGDDNLETCQSLSKTVESIGKMQVITPVIANCYEPSGAHSVLHHVLEYLERNILSLEMQYAESCQQELISLHQLIESELSRANLVLKAHTVEFSEFKNLFEALKGNLTRSLGALMCELEQDLEKNDSDFEKVVRDALQDCEAIALPSEIEISNRYVDCSGKRSYSVVLGSYTAELRVQLSKSFLTLDKGLQQAANQLKAKIADILVNEVQLGRLIPTRRSEFLQAITQLLIEQDNGLVLGFQTLCNFNISYGSLILGTIRQNLVELLDPDSYARVTEQATDTVSSAKGVVRTGIRTGIGLFGHGHLAEPVAEVADDVLTDLLNHQLELSAKAVRQRLEMMHRRAISRCEEILTESWLKAPHRLRYYMAQEFVDLILYDQGIESEWEKFLWKPEVRSKVWDKFGKIEQLKEIQQTWMESVQKVQNLNQVQDFTFFS